MCKHALQAERLSKRMELWLKEAKEKVSDLDAHASIAKQRNAIPAHTGFWSVPEESGRRQVLKICLECCPAGREAVQAHGAAAEGGRGACV